MEGSIPSWRLPAEILEVWHSYRVNVLLSAMVLLGVARFTLYLRSRRSRLNVTPSLGSRLRNEGGKDTAPFTPDGQFSLAKSVEVRPAENAIVTQEFRVQRVQAPKRVLGGRRQKGPRSIRTESIAQSNRIQPLIFYSSLGGTTEFAAKRLLQGVNDWRRDLEDDQLLDAQLLDLSYIEYDEYFTAPPKGSPNIRYLYMILIPSFNIDTVLNNFLEHLRETHHDFRIDTAPLSQLLGFSVFGFGDREGWPTEEEGFCFQAKEVDKWMSKLTAKKRAYPVGMGDVKLDGAERLREWRIGVQEVLLEIAAGKGLGEGVPGSGDAVESDEEDVEDDATQPKSSLADVEDIGEEYRGDRLKGNEILAVDFTTSKQPTIDTLPPEPKEMVAKNSPTYAALTKQGYTIVGSHSGVKICRWTKSALRGRGSCYKYSFYGIQSHLCMETTPSLSCSNKCVFCWRHGTNPVGTTWRWRIDPPDTIFAGVKAGHYQKIKMLKGVPGLRADRFAAAQRIRHCALSLVGEPIFYPHINAFVALLHAEHISSFLVCNAQHPDQLAVLHPVTQLYVSIDASNADALRKIDRPLHRDFWQRFTRCLDILRERRFEQRTVFRLTLVKGFNMDPDEVAGYADLVVRGLPCFVEVKGVTFCGTSTSSSAGLTMQNVPFYTEVAAFVVALNAALARRGLDYGIAAEHAHSCCVLIASKRFLIGGRWHTRIGYDKFFRCLEKGEPFKPEDYVDDEPTPEWALWGHGGFDPRDERVDRKGNKKEVVLIDYKKIEVEYGRLEDSLEGSR